MRNVVLALCAILTLGLTSPVFAVECNPNQNVATVLDWKDFDSKPQLILGFRAVSEKCVDGPASFEVKGMPGSYASSELALRAFKHLQAVSRLGMSTEQLTDAMAYIKQVESAGGDASGTNLSLAERDSLSASAKQWTERFKKD